MKRNRVSIGVAPEDLQVGDFVAVVSPKRKQRPKIVMGRDSDGDPVVMHLAKDESGAEGVPHKVLGLSWPWIVFGVLVPGGEIDGPVIHDLREIKCMRLDDGFVQAIQRFEKPERSQPEATELPF